MAGSEQHSFDGLAKRLAGEFEGLVPPQRVAAELKRTLHEYEGVPVTMFVEVIAEREVRDKLRLLARQSA